MNRVKDQDHCGSDWSLALTSLVETQFYIDHSKLLELSSHQLMYCEHEGGCTQPLQDVSNAMNRMLSSGLQLKSTYDWNAQCDDKAVAKIEKIYLSDPSKTLSKEEIKIALQSGPLFAIVDGSSFDFRHYSQGIIDTLDCGTKANHAVLIVGHGNENGLEYFLIQNSYSTAWGEDGYARIAAQIEGKGYCGLQQVAMLIKTQPIN